MGMITDTDRQHLQRCVELARQALAAGDELFGSVLVAADGAVLHEDRNRIVSSGDATWHPELELARWAQQHLSAPERATATVYTSGEHCPMCAAAHAWVGLGRIVYASSSQQLTGWLQAMGVAPTAVAPLPIQQVAPGLVVDGPVADLAEQVRLLHLRRQGR